MVELYLTLIGVTWLVTLGGGRQNPPWVFGNFIYNGVKLEKEEDWCEPVRNTRTPLSTLTQFLLLFKSAAQKYILR